MQNKKEDNSLVLMDFSGIYQSQDFYKNMSMQKLILQELEGTNCYCDDQALEVLRKEIEKCSYHGIHFLDSGNYHYMTKIWMEKIQEPFTLIVFDHHTDLQPPAFGGILSCGGWIAAALEELPFLKEVVLIGPEEATYAEVEEELQSRIHFLSHEKLKTLSKEECLLWIKQLPMELPVYISVDKDILSEKEVKTNWSQGEVTEQDLFEYLKQIQFIAQKEQRKILGMDVCGEADIAYPELLKESNELNRKLLDFWMKI